MEEIIQMASCFDEITSIGKYSRRVSLYGTFSRWISIREEFEGFYLTSSKNKKESFYRDEGYLVKVLAGDIRSILGRA